MKLEDLKKQVIECLENDPIPLSDPFLQERLKYYKHNPEYQGLAPSLALAYAYCDTAARNIKEIFDEYDLECIR